jgi:two-component system invasion response regulator UvrY
LIRVLIADDHPVVRRGLKRILEDETDMEVIGEARNGQEALDLVSDKKCDVVILDIEMPGRSGLDVLKDLKQYRPKLAVLVLSIHPEEQFAVRVLRAGAVGYLSKESAPDELVKAIRTVFWGKRYISAWLADRLASELGRGMWEAPHETLSNREFEVLKMIASGKTVSQIAKELSFSVKTISTYRARILAKMGMKTNAELTHYAIENKLA